MRLVRAELLVVLVGWCHAQGTLHSPCPDVFKYEGTGVRGRWDVILTIYSNHTIYPLWFNIVLDNKADALATNTSVLSSWIADVTTTDNMDFKIGLKKLSNHTESHWKAIIEKSSDVRFYVKYNPELNIPRIIEIKLNGKEICNVTIPAAMSDRLVFKLGEKTAKKMLRKKREYSWMNEITWNTKPSTQISTENNPNSWFSYISGPQPKPPSSQPMIPAPNPNFSSNTDQSEQDDWTKYITGPVPTRPQLVFPVAPAPQPVVPAPQPVVPAPQPVVPAPQPVVPPPQPMAPAPMPVPKPEDQVECGTLDKNIASALIIGGHRTVVGQWPWQVALYRSEHVNNEFFCGGTLVSKRHVVTAAICVTREGLRDPVETNSLSVYLGRHNLHSTTLGVQIRFVAEIIVHPQYNVTIVAPNVATLRLQEPVQYTEVVRPVCLWPEDSMDLSSVIGKIGTVVGWGIDATNEATEELTQVEMPVVEQETCIRSYSAFFGTLTTDTTYCAGYKDGKAPCNGDGGGGMVMKMGSRWYLRGLVSLSVALETNLCDPSHYVIFTDLAKFAPWIKENIR